jgi:ABC-type branched-subunit amino acid transport system substrate-binding protein
MNLRAFAASLMLLSMLAAPGPSLGDGPEERLSAIIEDIEMNGPNARAVDALKALIREDPDGASTDEALFVLARLHARRKDTAPALAALERLIEDFPESGFKAEALYEIGHLSFSSGEIDRARSALKAVHSAPGSTVTLRARSAMLIRDMEAASGAATGGARAIAIGALLPLEGGYRQFGEDALKGVLLAAGVFGGRAGEKATPVEVIVRNVGADAAEAEAAVNELSGNERVAGLVGPLLSSTAMEAVRRSQARGLPVVALSQREGVTDAGDYVFRNFLTPRAQASAIASYAAGTLGLKRYAIMYPQNNYGTELARLFAAEVERLGGSVVGEVSYQSGATDYSAQVKQLFGVQVKERKEGRKTIKEYTPSVVADALYIPDFHESVALLAPYIGFYNIKDVRLLGSNGWNSPRLPEMGGKDVEGAVFVDGFFSASARPATAEFSRRFKEVYGAAPGIMEAQAFDAAAMLIRAAAGGGEGTPERREIRDRLRSISGLPGATGDITFDQGREAVKKLFILTVKGGRIVEAPDS